MAISNSQMQYKNKLDAQDNRYNSVSTANYNLSSTLTPASFLPPLPPLPAKITSPNNIHNLTTHPMLSNITPDVPVTMTRESLHRLEVETGSSQSLPISFPYFFLDQTDAQDNFNLWQSDIESSVQPPQPQSQSQLPKDTTKSEKELPPPPTPEVNMQNQGDHFNPKRFSEFVIDQSIPYVSQRLDNLSVTSHSLASGYEIIPAKRNNSQGSPMTLDRFTNNKHDDLEVPGQQRYRDISDSMGSQATIFSTRQELQDVMSLKKERKRTGFLFKKKSKRTSNVRVQTASSTNSSLMRTNAIKSKQGSWLYRLKVRIRKMLAKFKFYSFKVPSKRTASIKRAKRTQTLVRKERENPQNKDLKRMQSIRRDVSGLSSAKKHFPDISAPTTNPNLGKQPVFKVSKIDDHLKYRAGAPKENVYIHSDIEESFGKLNHLSEYIYQQEADYMKKIKVASDTSKSILPSPDFNETESALLTASVTTNALTMPPVPPPPPPHIDHSFTTNPAPILQQYDFVELWQSYLKQVLFKRIQLRQEINMFRDFVANHKTLPGSTNTKIDQQSQSQPTDSTNNGSSVYSSVMEPVRSQQGEKSMVRSDNSKQNSDSCSVYTTDSHSSNGTINKDEEFTSRVMNRRSMLGDMLEYYSDEPEDEEHDNDDDEDDDLFNDYADTTSSISKSNSILSKQSDILLKRYGTVKRKTSSVKESSTSPMKRSFGLNHSLSSIAK
ncbi:hypothetical protein G210_2480 [Candida maltosa Xu316]|uniref:Uncharacterized protein n=1 Tax=Candida maltosa (strain Xu316) TaxID=1245528 RepID=M3JWA0_CANMX|nr:hypothetical protein G210_2480 [Candida maltosa Xu316]